MHCRNLMGKEHSSQRDMFATHTPCSYNTASRSIGKVCTGLLAELDMRGLHVPTRLHLP